jgi:predicted  nucleic acid-binding Zn-ribbon protein
MSNSLTKHSQSLVDAAKISSQSAITAAEIAARQQAKNRTQQAVSEINARIDSLRDSKRTMVLRMTEPHVIDNERAFDALQRAINGIDDEIDLKTEQLNGMFATPTKNNRSPNDV